jgi:hypothetical protein
MWYTVLPQDHKSNELTNIIIDPVFLTCLLTLLDLGTRLNKTTGRTSTIDLTLASPNLPTDFTIRIPETFSSDHYPVLTTFHMLEDYRNTYQVKEMKLWSLKKERLPA